MQYRTVLVVLALALCATLAPGTTARTIDGPDTGLPPTLDMAVEISRPQTLEVPGLMPVAIRVTDSGDADVLADSLQVTISDGYYSFTTAIHLSPGQVKLEYMPVPWVYGGGTETCTAWITYPDDMNHHNDTDVVIVNPASGLSEGTRTDVSGSLGRLSASIARTTCFVSHTEPLNVTLFDINGRAALACHLGAAQAGKSSLDLRGLRSGVYLARLDDGHRSVVQKLVLQR
jgi:hypothetical protein